ncbi:MAG: SDR family oxidoreductase [Candidatus Kapabacteria bacterium]|nr:SDR family oxidoreductase [Candidatus Kapabacteria bacterium]
MQYCTTRRGVDVRHRRNVPSDRYMVPGMSHERFGPSPTIAGTLSTMTVLLTGAGGQLGQVVAAYLTERSIDVIAADRDRVDLSNPADCERFVHDHASSIHAVVHLVGGIRAGQAIAETSPDDVAAMMDLNFITTFNVLRAAIRQLISNGGGSIVTVGAKAVLQPEANRAAYAAAKAAVVSLTLSAAEEGREHGIRANCIIPDVIRTPANLEWGTPEQSRTWVDPSEIASVIYDLIQPTCAISAAVIPMFKTTRGST